MDLASTISNNKLDGFIDLSNNNTQLYFPKSPLDSEYRDWKWKSCNTCSLSLGITTFKADSNIQQIKLLPNSSCIILQGDRGYHLKDSCCPKNTDTSLNLIYSVLSKTNISPIIQRDRDIDIKECPVCYEKLSNSPDLSLVVLPCQHTICAKCLVSIFQTTSQCPMCRKDLDHHGESIFMVPPDIIRSITQAVEYPTNLSLAPPTINHRTSSVSTLTRSLSAPLSNQDLNQLNGISFDLANDPLPNINQFEQNRNHFFTYPLTIDPSIITVVDSPPGTYLEEVRSPILLNCITQKLGYDGYNDLVVFIYDRDEMGEFSLKKIVRFDNQNYEGNLIKIKHSGDLLSQDTLETGTSIETLKHNALITGNTDNLEFKVLTLDQACFDSSGVSSTQNIYLKRESDKLLDQLISLKADEPDNILIFSQVIYNPESQSLRNLSPNMTPSSGFMTTNQNSGKSMNMCTWTHDEVPMTFWGAISIKQI